MSERYRVEIAQTQTTEVIVVATSPQEASERALRGEGYTEEHSHQEAFITRITVLEK